MEFWIDPNSFPNIAENQQKGMRVGRAILILLWSTYLIVICDKYKYYLLVENARDIPGFNDFTYQSTKFGKVHEIKILFFLNHLLE